MKKLQTSIKDSTQVFDETLSRLFERKVKSEMVIYQEELKIANLVFSIVTEEELVNRETELNHLPDKTRKMKTLGEQKTVSMVESKDFRTGIIQQEWEHMRMRMQMEVDLNNKAQDIQMLKVSRKLQVVKSYNQ
ncbi:UNVERIFIED_CONTAM: hypothetical protein FKN15_029701 [Acipenser sinensis]